MDILVPIFVCVILPVSIVLIVSLRKANSDNKNSQILIKAIEANKDIDTDKLIEALRKPHKTPLEIRNSRLLRGCLFSLIGLFSAAIGIVNYAFGVELSEDTVTFLYILGVVGLAIGISNLIVFFVTRKQVNTDE